jgi:hypothetical protein
VPVHRRHSNLARQDWRGQKGLMLGAADSGAGPPWHTMLGLLGGEEYQSLEAPILYRRLLHVIGAVFDECFFTTGSQQSQRFMRPEISTRPYSDRPRDPGGKPPAPNRRSGRQARALSHRPWSNPRCRGPCLCKGSCTESGPPQAFRQASLAAVQSRNWPASHRRLGGTGQ